MDIEGAECLSLEGMRELSDRNPQLRLIMEFHPLMLSAAGTTSEEMFSRLNAIGFNCFFAIRDVLEPVDDPSTLFKFGPVNLLCQKSSSRGLFI